MMPLLRMLSIRLVGFAALVMSMFVQAEDIDMFVGGSTATGGLPNVIIMLDNTANWSRANQQWPESYKQGQSEIEAVRTAIQGLEGKVNIGLMAYTTGTGTHDGGYVRFALTPLDSTSMVALETELTEIRDNFNKTDEQHAANTPYGNLIADVYNYLGGGVQSNNGTGTLPEKADRVAYNGVSSPAYSRFSSPLSADSSCVKTYVIFISNPNSSGPSTDSEANSKALLKAYSDAVKYYGSEDMTPDRLAAGLGGSPALPIQMSTTTTTSTEVVELGWTAGQCYASATACSTAQMAAEGMCAGVDGCVCTSEAQQASCPDGTKEYMVKQTYVETNVAGTGISDTTAGGQWNLDDWTKFLNRYGVPINYQEDGETKTVYMPVATYTIDVFYAQPNAKHTGLMLSAAEVGGGKYFAARSQAEIARAINKAVSEILSANTTFAAVALPLSATNRAQNENQVFIGMFRPDGEGLPRWYGNLKRYQIALLNGKAELADVNSDAAVNPLTDFPTECATSFWSVDSGSYWGDLFDAGKLTTPYPRGNCRESTTSAWSDAPDGPYVEKGGAAQMLRNYPSAASPNIASRNVKTVGTGTTLAAFDAAFTSSVDGGAEVIKFIRGEETETQVVDGVTSTVTRPRHDIHGDVVHSRPLPINFGKAAGIRVFYGTNDGLLRAINAATGMESWSFVAPEHFSRLRRLMVNSPRLPGASTEYPIAPKGYFFDGPIGTYLEYDDDNAVTTAYIYPTMRRGGRMVYAFNVTDPDSPKLMWRKGCKDFGSDSGCDGSTTGTEDFSDIGQTWSMPKATKLRGINLKDGKEKPVVIFGGGYDACEDADALATTCAGSSKGRVIYVLDAAEGYQVMTLKHADMGRISADISLVSMHYDEFTDYAYAVDLSGNVWRVSFIDSSIEAKDRVTKIAYTDDDSNPRKFLNAPSVLPYQGKVYLAFGSGNRERPLQVNYPYELEVEDRYYVFLDNPSDSGSYDLDDGSGMYDYTTQTSCTSAGVYGATARRGWFMGLPGRGEQVVTTSVIAGGAVNFNTYRPNTSSVGMCKPGVSTSYQVNLFNASGAIGTADAGACGGKRSVEVLGGGMPISPTFGTVIASDPQCTGDACSEQVSFCIGCQGLSPIEVEPNIDQVRERSYWNSDIDR